MDSFIVNWEQSVFFNKYIITNQDCLLQTDMVENVCAWPNLTFKLNIHVIRYLYFVIDGVTAY